MLTSREIIFANLNHESPPRCGFHFGGERLNDFVGGGPGEPQGAPPNRHMEGEYEYYDDIWGNHWKRLVYDGAPIKGEVFRGAIEDWSDLENFRPPVYDRVKAAACYRAGFDTIPGKFNIAGLPGWIFNDARYIRRMDNYFMDMALYPEELHKLHRLIATVYETLILAAGDAGADAIFFCEDMGTQKGLLFSPDMWNEYFRDLYTRLFSIAHEKGIRVFMHSCGRNTEIVESLLKAGVNCFDFDQPSVYDFDWLSGLFRKYKAALHSPVDIQKILPTGDRALIENEVERMKKAFGGFLIFKNYGDLKGIGVKPEWDQWAYRKIITSGEEK